MEELAQNGLLTNPTSHTEYLTFVLNTQKPKKEDIDYALTKIFNIEKSVSQKDSNSQLTITTAFSAKAWPLLFPDQPLPKELHTFQELKDGSRHFPSTPGDIFFMIKSTRMDLNYQSAKHLRKAFKPFADLTEDIQGFQYLDNRDMIDFVDGTENPKGDKRTHWVLTEEKNYKGGSYLVVQKYIDHFEKWDELTDFEQEGAIGRTKMDDIEIDDDKKTPYAHNVKSKVHVDGVEQKMLRQNRPFGNAMEHGTMFIGFAKSVSILEKSLKQMITADKDGNYDKLLDFVTAKTGANYFVPPASFFDDYQ